MYESTLVLSEELTRMLYTEYEGTFVPSYFEINCRTFFIHCTVLYTYTYCTTTVVLPEVLLFRTKVL
jgi:hypothetical protein